MLHGKLQGKIDCLLVDEVANSGVNFKLCNRVENDLYIYFMVCYFYHPVVKLGSILGGRLLCWQSLIMMQGISRA